MLARERSMTAKPSVLERSQFLPRTRSEIFSFFADAANLQRLTPSSLGFEILTPSPIEMKAGALIDYRLHLFGIPFRWRTRIEEFTPETRFVDVQLKGPYALWHHEHDFEDAPGGTLVHDRVRYRVGFGPFGRVARALMVDRQLARIFDFRRSTLETMFPA
jgi:hypothetical protein